MIEDDYDDLKFTGELSYLNKRKNLGRVGTGRSAIDGGRTQRQIVAIKDRASHHSRRNVLDQGIKDGAQEAWLPTTTCAQKRKGFYRKKRNFYETHAFGGFKKFRYRGEICQLLEKNQRTDEENRIIKEMVVVGLESQSSCRRCRYYFQMLKELPDLDTVANIQDVKEMYRNRKL